MRDAPPRWWLSCFGVPSPACPRSSPPFTAHFAPIAGCYDIVLSDVWGVIHNGVAATREACDALMRFRQQGGSVVLITNAPRPGTVVAAMTLDALGVPRQAYDGIVSSGDVTHALIAARAGRPVFHIGPERDIGLFDGLNAPLADLGNSGLRGLLRPCQRRGRDPAGLSVSSSSGCASARCQ